ncbi:serine hydrolase [Parabacteroides sp. PF5-9]|uniref:serine hydrolase domain-containing protein n=1 Tax=Parabacteroides sp. PF5-9 TaxID=1742404 RepID=UPI002473C530|nr:serine hydrolase [Parabacteroides sp. PF5-9]MDH6358733.1 CubicO group peptidase (beta-lactamase class C family) [Parabacteroides sp. PF5-9]
MKRLGVGIIILICGVGLFLALPSNYYLRRALVHLTPTIDQYPIFENRVIRADDPQPWPFAAEYNTHFIDEKFIPVFEELGTVAFIVIKDGRLLFEQYWQDYSAKSHSNSFSMAKSIVSLGIGCAIDDGFIQSVDQPVSDFVDGFAGYGNKPLTIRHLLTMSAGVDFQEAYTSPFSPTTKLYYGCDLWKVTSEMKEIDEPGRYVVYQSGVTQLLAFVLEKATDEKISSYISRKLWTPMHAEEHALWSLDKEEGMEKAYCCFNSNARDFARFGQLILNKGTWNDKQLVSENYIKTATSSDNSLIFQEYNEPNNQYGYQFWILNFNGMNIPYMRGIYGQYVFVIPDKNAVIVRLGHQRSETRTDQHYPDDIDTWLAAGLAIIDKTNTN